MTENIMAETARPERFRILIIGRANAGKTTILRAVCGAEGEPDVYDQDGNKITMEMHSEGGPHATPAETEAIAPRSARRSMLTLRSFHARIMRKASDSVPAPSPHLRATPNTILSPCALRGKHNIEYSLMFPSSPGFIFHDSCGFESGSNKELELVRDFIQNKANLGSVKNQLHAIWYCFPTDNNRFMTAAEKKFFGTIDTGHVPVVAIFPKFDALDAAAYNELIAKGVPFKEARRRAPECAQEHFDQVFLPFLGELAHPPRAMVFLRNMHNTGSPGTTQAASELIESTVAALDDSALKVLLIQAQRVNVELCMKAAVNNGIITKAAQDATKRGLPTFTPLQQELIMDIFDYFPFIWTVDDLEERASEQRVNGQRMRTRLVYAASAFIKAITPLVHSSLYCMPPPLQILSVGCAAVIVAANAFWPRPGYADAPQIAASSKQYIQSGAAEHVKEAILEAFPVAGSVYGTPGTIAVLQQLVLNNQI